MITVKTKRKIEIRFLQNGSYIKVNLNDIEKKISEDAAEYAKEFNGNYAMDMLAFFVETLIELKIPCPWFITQHFVHKKQQSLHEALDIFWSTTPPISKPSKKMFFYKMLGMDKNDKIISIVSREMYNVGYVEILRTIELQEDYEINGIKVSEIEENFEWQKKLKEREASIQKEIKDMLADKKKKLELDKQEYFKQMQTQFEKKFAEIEAKEKQLTSGFQDLELLFDRIQKPSLAELQAADFITADEKRIICGLLPKTN